MKNYYINTSQGSWTNIMHHLKGIDQGELVIITGEHNDIDMDYLNNLWGFSLYKTLYYSYESKRNEVLYRWRCSRLVPIESEINSLRFIDIGRDYDIRKLKKAIEHIRPELLFIENIDFSNDFDTKIKELKALAKAEQVAIVVHINPKFVNLDNVLSSSLLGKIIYLTNRAAYIYTSPTSNGIKIPIYHLPKNHNIWEDDKANVEATKRFQQEKTKQKFYETQLNLNSSTEYKEQVKEEVKEKKKDTTKVKNQTFGY